MAYEGLDIVNAHMIERLQGMGISLNVISDDNLCTQRTLLKLGVNGIMIKLPEYVNGIEPRAASTVPTYSTTQAIA